MGGSICDVAFLEGRGLWTMALLAEIVDFLLAYCATSWQNGELVGD